jgi:hypothetical protein
VIEPYHKGYFYEIESCLSLRGYKDEKVEGLSYWLWQHSKNSLIFYVKRSRFDKSSLIFIDARLVDLKNLLVKVKNIFPPLQGMTPNSKFHLFQVKRRFIGGEHDGKLEHEGWKFRFKTEQSCNSFLDICEAYIVGGIQAAEIKASEFAQIAVPKTSKSVVTESRVGQARFRKNLIKYWKTCAVTDFRIERLLRASHIKPWNVANPNERLDSFNGLLLVPNLDALFDDGFIPFDKQGHIFISSKLLEEEYATLGLAADMKLRKINGAHASYLAYHFEHVFKP